MPRPPAVEPRPVATCFALVGEHRDDPDRLLLLGDDGRYYEYRLPDGQALPAEPDGAEWAVDPGLPAAEDLLA